MYGIFTYDSVEVSAVYSSLTVTLEEISPLYVFHMAIDATFTVLCAMMLQLNDARKAASEPFILGL